MQPGLQDARKEALEGQNPDAVKQVPGTAEETEKPEITSPQEPEPAGQSSMRSAVSAPVSRHSMW